MKRLTKYMTACVALLVAAGTTLSGATKAALIEVRYKRR